MRKKIFRSTVSVIAFIIFLSLFVVLLSLNTHLPEVVRGNLRDELEIAAKGVKYGKSEYLSEISSENYRITWISRTGNVIYDSKAEITSMSDHSKREEIINALEYGYGESSRYSDTLMQMTIYSAIRLDDGSVLRISTGTDSVYAIILRILTPLALIAILGTLISSFFAEKMAQAIVRPLKDLDPDDPKLNGAYEEIVPILRKISRQHRQITDQMDELRKKADEFDQITYSMTEGLILLDENGTISRMNPAARKIFGLDKAYLGYDFLVIDRSLGMMKAVEGASKGRHSEFRETRLGREYQFSVSGIASGGVIVGCLILCFDITESAFAERNRREFTANVSHELKTPLQSIIGSAELLETGLVKPEDTGKFVGNIKNEAKRLVSLINDIIRLSQLDENELLPPEEADLYEIASEAISVLSEAAKKKNITISLKGERAVISGIRRYLYEIIYNLCDNAIRYNKEGGKIDVQIRKKGSKTILSVSDTGIGIPHEHIHRIFERFYRVDKSHSRETGGTGLGLSIVKHAAAYHNAQIKIDSIPDEGTTITITF